MVWGRREHEGENRDKEIWQNTPPNRKCKKQLTQIYLSGSQLAVGAIESSGTEAVALRPGATIVTNAWVVSEKGSSGQD